MNLAEHPTVRRFRESNRSGNAEPPKPLDGVAASAVPGLRGFTRLVVAAAGEDLMVRMFGHGLEVLYIVRAVELASGVLVMVAIARHEPGLSLKAVDT